MTCVLQPQRERGGRDKERERESERERERERESKREREDAFTRKHFYIQTLLHTDVFTLRHFYTQTLFHTDPFTHRRFYTQTLLHTDASTETFTQRRSQSAAPLGDLSCKQRCANIVAMEMPKNRKSAQDQAQYHDQRTVQCKASAL